VLSARWKVASEGSTLVGSAVPVVAKIGHELAQPPVHAETGGVPPLPVVSLENW
jgi:hypothetical protein